MTNPTPAAATGNAASPYPHIFMQWHGEGPEAFPLPDSDEVTWAENRINESDVEYVPASELAAVTAERAWQPISILPPLREFLPGQSYKEKPYVLVVDAKGRMSIAYAHRLSKGELHWAMAKPIGEVTNWMPLPTPPQP